MALAPFVTEESLAAFDAELVSLGLNPNYEADRDIYRLAQRKKYGAVIIDAASQINRIVSAPA